MAIIFISGNFSFKYLAVHSNVHVVPNQATKKSIFHSFSTICGQVRL
ncbi:hypothetical protein HOG21_04270 [bacterium]|nr:hypothetical protein [bacterium]